MVIKQFHEKKGTLRIMSRFFKLMLIIIMSIYSVVLCSCAAKSHTYLNSDILEIDFGENDKDDYIRVVAVFDDSVVYRDANFTFYRKYLYNETIELGSVKKAENEHIISLNQQFAVTNDKIYTSMMLLNAPDLTDLIDENGEYKKDTRTNVIYEIDLTKNKFSEIYRDTDELSRYLYSDICALENGNIVFFKSVDDADMGDKVRHSMIVVFDPEKGEVVRTSEPVVNTLGENSVFEDGDSLYSICAYGDKIYSIWYEIINSAPFMFYDDGYQEHLINRRVEVYDSELNHIETLNFDPEPREFLRYGMRRMEVFGNILCLRDDSLNVSLSRIGDNTITPIYEGGISDDTLILFSCLNQEVPSMAAVCNKADECSLIVYYKDEDEFSKILIDSSGFPEGYQLSEVYTSDNVYLLVLSHSMWEDSTRYFDLYFAVKKDAVGNVTINAEAKRIELPEQKNYTPLPSGWGR